jgi:hypothetical protein
MENVFVWAQGPVTRRPGTEYIAEADANCTAAAYPVLRPADDTSPPSLAQTTAISDVNDLNDVRNGLGGNYYLTQDIDCANSAGWNGGVGWWPIGMTHTTPTHNNGTRNYTHSPFTGTFDGNGFTISNVSITTPNGPCGLFCDVEGTIIDLTVEVDFTANYGGGLAIQTSSYSDGNQALFYNCHVSGSIDTNTGSAVADNLPLASIGGFIGSASGKGTTDGEAKFYDCTSSVNIDLNGGHTDTAFANIGGFVGLSDIDVEYYNCTTSGTVDACGYGASPQADYIGGFVGYASDQRAFFYDCNTTGTVSGDRYVGGFIGLGDSYQTIARCSARGNVEAYVLRAGGFGGQLNSNVQDCYAWGDVTTASDYCGGFAGGTVSGYFRQCYAIGALTGGTVGGFLGTKGGVASAATCFWDTETTGTETTATAGATGKTTAQMQTQSTYGVTWDFDTVWYMPTCDSSVDSMRLIPFEYSTDDAYVLALTDGSMGFFRTTE